MGGKGNTSTKKSSDNKPNSQALAAIRQARTVRRQQQEAERIQLGRRSSLESVLSTSLEADDFFIVQRDSNKSVGTPRTNMIVPTKWHRYTSTPQASTPPSTDSERSAMNPLHLPLLLPSHRRRHRTRWQRLLQAQREVVDSFSTMSSQNKTSTLRRRISSMIRSVPAGRVSC